MKDRIANFRCEGCGKLLVVPESMRGAIVTCGTCETVSEVPLQDVPVAKPPKRSTPRAIPWWGWVLLAPPVIALLLGAAAVTIDQLRGHESDAGSLALVAFSAIAAITAFLWAILPWIIWHFLNEILAELKAIRAK